jgi:hypothetical protein
MPRRALWNGPVSFTQNDTARFGLHLDPSTHNSVNRGDNDAEPS